MSTRFRMLRTAALGTVALLLVPLLSSCGATTSPERPPDAGCWLELSASPPQVRSGAVVTVTSKPECSLGVADDARWVVRVFVADWTAVIAEAEVDPENDGAFAADVSIPADATPGSLYAVVEGYEEYVECNDTGQGLALAGVAASVEAACAAPTAVFEVVP